LHGRRRGGRRRLSRGAPDLSRASLSRTGLSRGDLSAARLSGAVGLLSAARLSAADVSRGDLSAVELFLYAARRRLYLYGNAPRTDGSAARLRALPHAARSDALRALYGSGDATGGGPAMMHVPNRDVLLWTAVVCYGLAVVFGLLGVSQRVNLVAVGLALTTLAWLRG
jgi:hypothetical protein